MLRVLQMQMHIYHVNKPITIDFNSLMLIEENEGEAERTHCCSMEIINCPWLWLCPPFTRVAWHWQINTHCWLIIAGTSSFCTRLCLILINSFGEGQLSLIYKGIQRDNYKVVCRWLQEYREYIASKTFMYSYKCLLFCVYIALWMLCEFRDCI